MQKLPDVSIDKINSFNKKGYFIEIAVNSESITIRSLDRIQYERQLKVFLDIGRFFYGWVSNIFPMSGPYHSIDYQLTHPLYPWARENVTFDISPNGGRNLGQITDLTIQAVQEFIRDRNIPPENFQLVHSEYFNGSKYLRYMILFPKVAVTKHIRLNNLKELRF